MTGDDGRSATSKAYKALVEELVEKAEADDPLALRCLAALSLLAHGWRYGDPDPPCGGPGGGGERAEVIDLALWHRMAA